MLPDVGCCPGTTHVPICPTGVTFAQAHWVRHGPDVGVVRQTPALVDAIIVLGCDASRLTEILDKVEQRLMHLGEVGHLCCPVILLQIDVRGVVAAPRRQQVFVPESLQVGWHTCRA